MGTMEKAENNRGRDNKGDGNNKVTEKKKEPIVS